MRQVVHVSIGGEKVRLRLSNEYSASPLTIKSVHLAKSVSGGTIDAATDSAVKGGKSGFRDRELLFKAAKLVEGSGGVNVNVNQQMNFAAPGVEQGLPAWGDVRKEVTSGASGGEVKQLEAGVEWVDAEVEVEEKELVNELP